MRKTKQAGYVMRHRGWWVLRYRERVGVGGELKTVQRAKRLAPVDAEHKTKASVRDLAKQELEPITRSSAEPLRITKLGDFLRPCVLDLCKTAEATFHVQGIFAGMVGLPGTTLWCCMDAGG